MTRQSDSSYYGKVAQWIEHVNQTRWFGKITYSNFNDRSFKPVVVSSNLTLPNFYERVAQSVEQRKNKQYA